VGLTAAVAGASGYAGGELLRLLLAHPQFEIGPLVAAANAGRPVTDLHPNLPELAGRVFAGLDDEILQADVVFLALPAGSSAGVAATIPAGTLVVDIGADHRLADPAAWRRFYAGEHSAAWCYGLPELPGRRLELAGCRRIANPGCYPTAVILALAPLVEAGLVDRADVVVVASSGTTGAGRAPDAGLLASQVIGDLSAYKVGGVHQHIPEISQALGLPTLSFTAVLAPMPRGILATCTARLAAGTRTSTAAARAALVSAYASEPFVHVLPEGSWPHTAATIGSNSAHLQLAVDPDAGRVVVVSAIDNLGKGAAGQAVQNANIALGLPETIGLSVSGVGP